MGLYPLSAADARIETLVPMKVRDVARGDADLVGFFEGDISACSYAQLKSAGIPTGPALRLVPMLLGNEKRLPEGISEANYDLRALIYLPRETLATDAIAVPAKPTVSVGAAGVRTGGYRYVLTGGNSHGESYASAISDFVYLTAQKALVSWALRSDLEWFRLWRTKADQLCFRFLKVFDGGVSSFVDDLPDTDLQDELAPIEFMAELLRGYTKAVFLSQETLQLSDGRRIADAYLNFIDVVDKMPTDAGNQRVIELQSLFPHHFESKTRFPAADSGL